MHESLPVISPAESTREQFSTANWLLLFLKQKQKLNFFPSYSLCTMEHNIFWSCNQNLKPRTFLLCMSVHICSILLKSCFNEGSEALLNFQRITAHICSRDRRVVLLLDEIIIKISELLFHQFSGELIIQKYVHSFSMF